MASLTQDRSIILPRLLIALYLAAGVGVWVSWAYGVAASGGRRDPNGYPVGIDYGVFHTAAGLVRTGRGEHLYNAQEFRAATTETVGADVRADGLAFLYPPVFALLLVPLADLPYRGGYLLWVLSGIVALVLSLVALQTPRPSRAFCWALLFPPVFFAVRLGQNSFLSLLLFALGYAACRRGSIVGAGLLLGLLAYKMQLGLGLAIWWLTDWRRYWPGVAAAGGSAALLFLLSWAGAPEASAAWAALIGNGGLEQYRLGGYLMYAYTPHAFFQLLLPGSPLALWFTVAAAIAGIMGFLWLRARFPNDLAVLFSGATALTLWLAPRALVYDWTLLLVPMVLLWSRCPAARRELAVLGASLSLVSLISGPLTDEQVRGSVRFLEGVVQVSVPAFAVTAVLTAAAIERHLRPSGASPGSASTMQPPWGVRSDRSAGDGTVQTLGPTQ